MHRSSLLAILIVFLSFQSVATEHAIAASLYGGMGDCYLPPEPFGYKLSKSDPLYEAARQEHQEYLEGLENYVNCLDRERAVALDELRASFELFVENFGKDAVLRYQSDQ